MLNKNNIKNDFKLIIKTLKSFIKGFLIPLIYGGLPFWYFNYDNLITDINTLSLGFYIFTVGIIWFIGFAIFLVIFIVFAILSRIEERYFKDSFWCAYILRRYLMPFKSSELIGYNYDNIKEGYKKFKDTNL